MLDKVRNLLVHLVQLLKGVILTDSIPIKTLQIYHNHAPNPTQSLAQLCYIPNTISPKNPHIVHVNVKVVLQLIVL